MNRTEAEAIFDNEDKCITEDIVWSKDQQHYGNLVFEETLYCGNLQMRLKGSINPATDSLSFAIIHPKEGRIYGLDHGGHTHKNKSDKVRCGYLHKHRWRPEDHTWAYEPTDILGSSTEIQKVWGEFCAEAKIYHAGKFYPPNDGLFDDE